MKKIVITGPESTGKSALTQFLAGHFSCPFALEYAREYLENRCGHYDYEDLAEIAQGQLAAEEVALAQAKAQNSPLVFLDTDLITLKIWSEFKYGKCHPFILQEIDNRHYDFYLLCNTDLPWQPDPLREHPQQREELMNIHTQALIAYKKTYAVISGQGNTREENALQAIASFIRK